VGPVISEAYGATEVGSVTMITRKNGWPSRVSRRCLPPFEPIVVDDAGERLPSNRVGRLYFRDAAGRGVVYVGDAAKSAAVHLAPGVFTLGEIAMSIRRITFSSRTESAIW